MITLFVDASFTYNPRKVGFGAWAIHDSWERGYSFGGRMSRSIQNNTQAELVAISEAIRQLISIDRWHRDAVMIQSDSHHALSAILGNVKNASRHNHSENSVDFTNRSPLLTDMELGAVRYIQHAVRGHIYLRHIKGHTGGKEGRSWVNAQCDRLARKYANQCA